MIQRITKAEIVRYVDNLSTVAYVSWIDHRGTAGTTSGEPSNLHMSALLRRAHRERAPIEYKIQGWIPDGEELAIRKRAAKKILRNLHDKIMTKRL